METTIHINERRLVESFLRHLATKGFGAVRVELDEANGKLWEVFTLRTFKVTPYPTGFACQPLCGRRFRRPHLTCLFCRQRRIYYRQRPTRTEVKVHYNILKNLDKFPKNWLFKKVAVLFEFVAA